MGKLGSILGRTRPRVDCSRTGRIVGSCFVGLRGRELRLGGGTKRRFLGVGGKGTKIIALPDNLRCRILGRNRKTGPATSSGMGYRCRKALVGKAMFSDSMRHNRPTIFKISRIVPK